MPRARSPDSILAEKLYHEGEKLNAIATALGVPEGTVRRWKSTQKWDKNESERSDSKKPKKKANAKANVRKRKTNVSKPKDNAKKKKGAPKGNKNAVGNKSSAPRNQKAVKHGAYRSVFFNFLGDEDRELLDSMSDVDPEDRLLMEIQALTIRERRVMKAIEGYKNEKLYVQAIDQKNSMRCFSAGEEGEKEKAEYKRVKETLINAGVSLPGEASSRNTRTEATVDLIIRLDRELTSIQRQIASDIKQLEELRESKNNASHREELRKLELELLDARIEQLDAQTNKILGTDLELEDTSEIDALIYGGGDGNKDEAQNSPMSADPEGSETQEVD